MSLLGDKGSWSREPLKGDLQSPTAHAIECTLAIAENFNRLPLSETRARSDLDMLSCLPELFQALKPKEDSLLFTREHFSNISDVEHQLIEPPVLLFERLMKSPRAIVFWHAFLFGPKDQVFDIDNARHTRCRLVAEELSAEAKEKTLAALEQLSEHTIFLFAEQNDQALRGDAVTIAENNDAGSCALVVLTWGAIKGLLNCRTVLELQKQSLRIAPTLTHEISHAMNIVHYGNKVGEMFFRDDPFCEMGFALLSWLIGGDAACQKAGTEGFLLKTLALREMLVKYQRHGTPFPIRNALAEREYWLLADSSLVRLFSTEFWEHEVLDTKGRALKVIPV